MEKKELALEIIDRLKKEYPDADQVADLDTTLCLDNMCEYGKLGMTL